MTKFTNFKKLTAQTLLGILLAGGLVAPSNARQSNSNSCDNNGHGNNAPITITLQSGREVVLEQFDPSNPGNGGRLERELGKLGLNSSQVDEAVQLIRQGDYDFERKPSNKKGCDTDGDGIDDRTEAGSDLNNPLDTDGDGVPDFADLDSDNDGKPDSEEGTSDYNGNGVADRLEANGITVSIEAPKVQTSQLPSADSYYVVDFNNQSTGQVGFSETNGGTSYTYSSDLDVQNANQWGGAKGSKFITQALKKSIRSYNIKVDSEQKYFGFWWSAGDPHNQITFKKNGNEVAVFKTKDLVDFIQSSEVDDTQAYYGNPAYKGRNTGHTREPFSFVNVFFNDQEYDEIVVSTLTEGGSAFESDNHTFSTIKQNIRGNVLLGTNPDKDYDGLLDTQDPDPSNPDIDDDGLLDGNDPYPQDPDKDRDGLLDGQDPDPNNSDFDGDGLNDGDEVNTYGSDPRETDTDGDSVNDSVEVNNGTDPNNPDTDNDGLEDGDSKDPDKTNTDTDGDGINDGDEELGDYDGDEQPDYEIINEAGTPNDVDGDGIDNNEDENSDGDFFNDGEEIEKGRNPYSFDYFSD